MLFRSAGIALLEEKGIGANSPDGTYCSLDTAKVQAMFDLLKPIFTEQGVETEDSIDALYDNQYCEGAPGR